MLLVLIEEHVGPLCKHVCIIHCGVCLMVAARLLASLLNQFSVQAGSVSMAGERKFGEDAAKISYVKDALISDDRFVFPSVLDHDLAAALEWIADRNPTQV